MKNSILIICILVSGVFFQACSKESIRPSENIITKQYDITDFSSLDIADDFQVYITFSNTEENVSVEANENLMKFISVEKDNNTLKVRMKDNLNINGSETLNLYLSVAKIDEYKASGDVEIYLKNRLIADNVSIELSGDSKLDGALEVSVLSANLKGDSYLILDGSVDDLNINLSGDSKIERYDFAVKNLKIDLRGDSEGYLTVTESLEVKARGDSYMYYKGNPTILREDLAGDSELIKRD